MAKRSNTKKLVLVTGATGTQGGAVVRHLNAKGFPVRALTRDPDSEGARKLRNEAGVEVARGDFDDKQSLLRALEDVYGVFSVQTPYGSSVEAEVRQGIAMIDAAHASEVDHFIYSSVGSADQKTGIPHFESKFKIEEHLRATGMHHTILRPVYFMENWLRMKDSIDGGVLRLPLTKETLLQQISADDIASWVLLAFEHPGKFQNRAIDIAGDELFIDQTAQTLLAEYSQVPWEDFEKQVGEEMTIMFRWFQEVGYHADLTALREDFPDLMSLERWRNKYWTAKAHSV
jgi:uncharacterized protein YbjT (DUF2867 family)